MYINENKQHNHTIYVHGWWTKLSNKLVGFVLGALSENVIPLKGCQTSSPQIVKILKGLDLIDCQNTPDAFKHVPDLF